MKTARSYWVVSLARMSRTPCAGLADPLGEPANPLDALLAQLVDLPLQLRDQVDLDRVERDRGNAQNRVLDEHEGEDGEQRAALEGRRGERVADIAAQGLDLGIDHLHQLALGQAAVVRQRKAQHVAVEHVAQAAQHALGRPRRSRR